MKLKTIIGLILSLVFFMGQAQNKRRRTNKTAVETNVTKKNYPGFFDFSYDGADGRILLQVNRTSQMEQSFLYINGLSAGIGSNDICLYRGQLGNERVVHFTKMGNKLMLVQPNLNYRSTSENTLEQASIAQAFAKSVLFGFPIQATSATHYTIDLTPFLIQDAHGVSQRLKRGKQGSYSVDKSRSAVYLNRTKNFPQNSEFDVLLTFKGTPQGGLIRSVTPSPNSVSVHQHHSFVQLP